MVFRIEDQIHADTWGDFATLEEAMKELERRSNIPWDQEPNLAPCADWRTCGRMYVVIEMDDSSGSWRELSCRYVFEISADGIKTDGTPLR